VETNVRGNIVERGFRFNADRYEYDFDKCSSEKGWVQYDTEQDASYFGVWVHPEKRLMFTYVEGDTVLVTCVSEESYYTELVSMAEFYGSPPWAFKMYCKNGTMIKVYDERPGDDILVMIY